jgi:hypothetical protein
MVSITNDRGVELTRQIVGVGAMKPGEQRKFTVAVEVFGPPGSGEAESETRRNGD